MAAGNFTVILVSPIFPNLNCGYNFLDVVQLFTVPVWLKSKRPNPYRCTAITKPKSSDGKKKFRELTNGAEQERLTRRGSRIIRESFGWLREYIYFVLFKV